SRAELRLKLRRRGYQPGEIEEALTRLTELGYIDDAAFARALAGRRSGERGRRAIAAELMAKGVGRDVIQAALGEVGDDADLAAAMDAAPPAEKQRLGDELAKAEESFRSSLRPPDGPPGL